MTSWPPEPADWLTLKVGDGERGGCTRADVTGGLMGNRETDAAHCLQALSFCCSHFEFLSSLLSNSSSHVETPTFNQAVLDSH